MEQTLEDSNLDEEISPNTASHEKKIEPKTLLALLKASILLILQDFNFFFVQQWIRGVQDALWVPHLMMVLSKSDKVQFAIYDIILYNGFICLLTFWLFQQYLEPLITRMLAPEQFTSNVIQLLAKLFYFLLVWGYRVQFICKCH